MSLTEHANQAAGGPLSERDDAFWRAQGGIGLVWSNPRASDEIMIVNALLKPRFHQLLQIAVRFGFARLTRIWGELRPALATSDLPEERRGLELVGSIVERCLAHMREGVARW